MAGLTLNAILLVALPIAVFLGGAWAMGKIVGREYVISQLNEKAGDEDRKPLNQRFAGYKLAAVDRHWGALDSRARRIEKRFLQLDLVFPIIYGAAIGGGLCLAWKALGRPFQPIWILLPIAITVLSDWTENLVQLSQLHRYIEKGQSGLQSGWIKISSAATVVKLAFFLSALLMLLCLAGWMIFRATSFAAVTPI